jgi:hypothetical protein
MHHIDPRDVRQVTVQQGTIGEMVQSQGLHKNKLQHRRLNNMHNHIINSCIAVLQYVYR